MDGQAGQNAGGGQYQQGGGGPVAAQTIPMVYPPSGPPGGPGQPTAGYPAGPAPAVQPPPHLGQPMPYQYTQQHQQQLQQFWQIQMQEIEQATDFKNHNLPLARIKKIMKADEDVRMIAAEAPVVFAKACEMFILELTLRSWIHTEENKRRTLQKNDIAAAITRTDIFDFLVDIVPRDELREEGLGVPRSAVGTPADAAAAAASPYSGMIYLPSQPPHQNPGGGGGAPMQGMPPPTMMVGRPPAMHMDPSMYAHHQPRAPMPYLAQPQIWQQGPPLPPMANPNPGNNPPPPSSQ